MARPEPARVEGPLEDVVAEARRILDRATRVSLPVRLVGGQRCHRLV